MKDPIQDAVREVVIRIEQIRFLWSVAETARASAESEAERVKLRSAAEQAEAFEVRKENERLRLDAENGMRRDAETSKQLEVFRTRRYELEAAHATIWGLGCALTEAYADAKSARHARNRLRRSNDRVRGVLEAEPGEPPVAAAERLRGDLAHTAAQCDLLSETSGREIERLRADLGSVRGELRASENKRIAETQAIRAGWAEDREELLQRNRVVVNERDAAQARVAELEKKVTGMCKPPEGFLNDWQAARNECAAALFEVVRPGAEPPSQGTYVFNTALAEATEEINALRKDRETLNWVRGEAESEAKKLRELAGKERVVIDRLDHEVRSLRDIVDRLRAESAYQRQRFDHVQAERDAALARVAKLECAIDLEWSPYVRRAAEVKS